MLACKTMLQFSSPCLPHDDSLSQAISAFSPLAEWQETQAQLEPPASVEAGATSAALTASARPPEGALAAATSNPLLAAGSGIPQAASHAQSRQGPPRTGDMLLPPHWVPTVPLSSSTAGRPAQPAFSRNPEQDGPSQGIRTPAQHRPVSANLRGECLAAAGVSPRCGLSHISRIQVSSISSKRASHASSELDVIWSYMEAKVV